MTFKPKTKLRAAVALLGAALAIPVLAQDSVTGTRGAASISDEELAKKPANPVAALIGVPFRLDYDQDIGAALRQLQDADRVVVHVQHVKHL